MMLFGVGQALLRNQMATYSSQPKPKSMFGNNKKETGNKGKNSAIIQSGPTHSLNSLVQGTVIEGTVRSENDIRVDGTIKGNLHCDAKVIIGPTGHVEGEVTCKNAVIEGKFDGNITVDELLNIRDSANISGDVTTDKLIVQSGATFNVSCNMGVKPAGQQVSKKQNDRKESSGQPKKQEGSVEASKATQA